MRILSMHNISEILGRRFALMIRIIKCFITFLNCIVETGLLLDIVRPNLLYFYFIFGYQINELLRLLLSGLRMEQGLWQQNHIFTQTSFLLCYKLFMCLEILPNSFICGTGTAFTDGNCHFDHMIQLRVLVVELLFEKGVIFV